MSLNDPATPAFLYNLYQQLLTTSNNVAIAKEQLSKIAEQLSTTPGFANYVSPDEQIFIDSFRLNP